MNCPHCQKLLPENYTATFCPYCGAAIQQEHRIVDSSELAPVKINWLIFFGVLLAPIVVTALIALGGRATEQLSPITGFFGGAAAGIVCGIMLALRVGRNVATRIVLGIVFSGVFAVVCVMLSCFGCLAAGYQLNMH